jgi:squalene-associated FAD-dependent desaturase
VVGGGLAGLAAALELADAGQAVTLLEARPTLGGAVQTLPERDGDPSPPPDNGQHIALGCCDDYLEFLARIGSAGALRRERLSLPVIDERGRTATIGAGAAPLLRYRHLPLSDRLRVARATLRMRRLDPADHDGETFAGLLRRLGCSDAAVDRFWDVFIRPALNLRAEEVSAAPGVFTVQTALLGPRQASDLILPTAPLGTMHGDAAAGALEAAGATVLTDARVTGIEAGQAAVLADGRRVEGDAFVVALPPGEGAQVLGEEDPGLEDSPIVSVHLLFDRAILRHPLAALLGSPAHWVFDRGALTGHSPVGAGGTSRFPQTPSTGPPSRTGGSAAQYLTVVSSGAPELLEVRGRELVDLMAKELTQRLGPAKLVWSRVSREPSATFAARPGTQALRKDVRTGLSNVVRAGAWTDTGWPATMESAVRSGRHAARTIMSVKELAA